MHMPNEPTGEVQSHPKSIEWTGLQLFVRLLGDKLAFLKPVVSAADRFTLAIFPVLRRFLPLALLAALCAIAILSYLRTPWYDEAWFLDTGVELAKGNGFQNHANPDFLNITPAPLNYPLFMLFMNALIYFFGLNFYVIRGACFLLTIGACFTFMASLRRAGFFSSKSVFCLSLLFLFLSDGALNAGTHARPEGLTLFVFSMLLLCMIPKGVMVAQTSSAVSWTRLTAIAFCATLVPWCALHMLLPVVVGLAISWFLYGYDFKNVVAVGVGLCIGLASVFLFYYWTHSLETYKLVATVVESASPLQNFITRVREFKLGNWTSAFPVKRVSPIAISGWLFVVLGLLGPKPLAISGALKKHALATFLFSVGTCLGFSLFFNLWRSYSIYYVAPICVLLVAWLQQLFCSKHPSFALVGTFCLVAFCSFSPNLSTARLHKLMPEYTSCASYSSGVELVRDLITPEDVVISNYSTYYAVRPLAKDWYPLGSVLALDNERVEKLTKLCITENVHSESWTYFWRLPRRPDGFLDTTRLLDELSQRWSCTFTEITHQSVYANYTVSYQAAHAKGESQYRVFAIEHLATDVSQ